MENVVARVAGRPDTRTRPRPGMATTLLLCLGAVPAAWAFDDDTASHVLAESVATGADEAARPQMEFTARSLPLFENTDGASRTSRIGLTLLPPRRSALGLSLGMTSRAGPALPLVGPFAGSSPSVDLGVHWRHTLDNDQRFDVSAWRRMAPPDALSLIHKQEPSYGARVEMRLGPVSRTGFVADRGFLGFQMESGARITLRRSGGKPMIYYRTKF